jgi:hypothetical protein
VKDEPLLIVWVMFLLDTMELRFTMKVEPLVISVIASLLSKAKHLAFSGVLFPF